MSELKILLQRYYDSKVLPSYNTLFSLLDSAISVLEGESSRYRPKGKNKACGGLLDFSETEFSSLPVVVVPDIHARGKFFLDILNYRFSGNSSFDSYPSLRLCSGKTILECIESGRLILCCVGDMFHSESKYRQRWIDAFEQSSHGNLVNEYMTAEMIENLSLLEMILSLKSAYPTFFHVLKGNHENILNENSVFQYGNVPFRKFCDEGNMVCDFLQNRYDDLILHEISCFEKNLPVCAVFNKCVVSHAEPLRKYSRSEIINYHEKNSQVCFGLTWTANDKAEKDSVMNSMKNLLPKKLVKDSVWISGHRPVIENYALRQDGHLIQIHNPDMENVCIVLPEKKFDPDINIVNVGEKS